MSEISDLAKEITKELAAYNEEINNEVKEEIKKLAKEVRADLLNNPKVPVQSGRYKKGFKLKRIAEGENYIRFTVHNTVHQLTHLLEYGHIIKNQHDTYGRTKAFSHWQDAQKIADELPERIRKRIEQ